MFFKRIFSSLLITLLYLPMGQSQSLFALPSQSLSYERQIVETIDINIVTSRCDFDANSIKSRIKTKEGDLFFQAEFDQDLKMLAQEFDRIEPMLSSVNGAMHITLKIWPKPMIRTIQWDGNEGIPTRRLLRKLETPLGSVFNRTEFNKNFHKLKAYYIEQGFFEAQLNYKATLDPISNEIDIEISIEEGRAGRIQKIKFINFTKEEKEDLLEMIVSKKYCFFTSWMSNDGTYNEEAVQQDQLIILNYLQNKGYADAKVSIDVQETTTKNRIILSITATPGPKYLLSTLSFKGNTIFDDEDIWRQFFVGEEDAYSPEELRETASRIMHLYGRRGYIDAIVDYEPKLESDRPAYSVEFTIDEGAQFRVGLIKVLGNTSTQTNLILHETLLTPGEVFNVIKLEATEDRLKNVGFFKNVNVYAVKSDETSALGKNYRDVHLEVEETGTGNFGASCGFSTTESVFGQLSITERNFNYKGLGTFTRDGLRTLRGGGEYLRVATTVGTKTRSSELSWAKPFFNDTHWTVGFDVEHATNRYVSNDYDIHTTGFTIHGTYDINRFVRATCHYRFKYTDLKFSDCHETKKTRVVTASEEKQIQKLTDKEKNNPKTNKIASEVKEKQKQGTRAQKKTDTDSKPKKNTKEEESIEWCELAEIPEHLAPVSEKNGGPVGRLQSENSGFISAFGGALIYDTTNNPVRPTQGLKSRIESEIAGLIGHHSFFSVGYLNSYYFKLLDKKGVWKVRADARFLQPLSKSEEYTLPIDERFFLGGNYALRGYRDYDLGPQFTDVSVYGVCRVTTHKDGTETHTLIKNKKGNPIAVRQDKNEGPRGGISLQYLSLEYSRPIFSRLEGFAFIDSGHITSKNWGFGRMYTSIGYGVRIQLLESAPPLVLGVGHPLNPRNHSEVKRFFLTLGAQF